MLSLLLRRIEGFIIFHPSGAGRTTYSYKTILSRSVSPKHSTYLFSAFFLQLQKIQIAFYSLSHFYLFQPNTCTHNLSYSLSHPHPYMLAIDIYNKYIGNSRWTGRYMRAMALYANQDIGPAQRLAQTTALGWFSFKLFSKTILLFWNGESITFNDAPSFYSRAPCQSHSLHYSLSLFIILVH